MNAFEDMGLMPEIVRAVTAMGFEQPTPIQAQTIPHLLTSTRDVIASAQTGTGKTAAFGLPAVQLVDVALTETQVIVLCPTRELCVQITGDISDFAKFTRGIRVVAVYGGAPIQGQIRALQGGAHIVVATPGRAVDLIKRGKLRLGHVTRLVLDEADEMLSMGFKDDLDLILDQTPGEKQTLLFSATMSKEISAVTKKYMKDPLKIATAKVNTAAHSVEHHYYTVRARDKYELLKRLADMNPDFYGIVFCRTRQDTKDVANKLMHDGYNANALHGDLNQSQRDDVMGRFRKRHLQILVATDVAARGLDVNDLTHVINFSLPDDPEVYVHRSGRTGRAGKTGISIAIVHTREMRKIQDIQRSTKIDFTQMEVPSGKDVCARQLIALIDKIHQTAVDESQIEPFLPEIYSKLESLSREDLIKRFVSTEFSRFLSYYKNAPDINAAAEGRDSFREKGKQSRKERRSYSFDKLFINLGNKNHMSPARIMGIVNEALGSGSAAIGKIEINPNFSLFEIEKGVSDQLMKSLSGQEVDGIAVKVKPADASLGFSPKGGRGGKGGKKGNFKGSGEFRGGKPGKFKKSGGGGKGHRKGGSPKSS